MVKAAQEVNDVGGARKIEKSKSMREIIERDKFPLIDLQLFCDLVEIDEGTQKESETCDEG